MFSLDYICPDLGYMTVSIGTLLIKENKRTNNIVSVIKLMFWSNLEHDLKEKRLHHHKYKFSNLWNYNITRPIISSQTRIIINN